MLTAQPATLSSLLWDWALLLVQYDGRARKEELSILACLPVLLILNHLLLQLAQVEFEYRSKQRLQSSWSVVDSSHGSYLSLRAGIEQSPTSMSSFLHLIRLLLPNSLREAMLDLRMISPLRMFRATVLVCLHLRVLCDLVHLGR